MNKVRHTFPPLVGVKPDTLTIMAQQSEWEAVERSMNSFFTQVFAVVEQIPYGKVMSYGQIARMLGRPRAAREVGWAMRCCPEHLPWQRVVMADGCVTGGVYAEIRKALLETEGVTFLSDGRVDMDLYRWNCRDYSVWVTDDA